MKKNHLFTLIELLITIILIAILIALLIPAVFHAAQIGRSASCKSNLRQLGQAFFSYSDDYNGMLMPYVTGCTLYEHPGINWTRYLYPYYGSTGILSCPSSPKPAPKATDEGFHLYDGNYGWNYDGTQGNRGPLQIHIKQPSKGYLVFDSGDQCIIYGANNWTNLMEELDLDWDSQSEGCNRHRNHVNVCFVDCHVESLSLNQFLVAPCKSWQAPWYLDWDDKELLPESIPFPHR